MSIDLNGLVQFKQQLGQPMLEVDARNYFINKNIKKKFKTEPKDKDLALAQEDKIEKLENIEIKKYHA